MMLCQTKSMLLLLVLLLEWCSSNFSQAATTIDDCLTWMDQADMNGDEFLQRDEYIALVEEGLGGCVEELNLVDATFYNFACRNCASPTDATCCVRNEANVSLANTNVFSVCSVVVTAIQASPCPEEATPLSPTSSPMNAKVDTRIIPIVYRLSLNTTNTMMATNELLSLLIDSMDQLLGETTQYVDLHQAKVDIPSGIELLVVDESCVTENSCWIVSASIQLFNSTLQISENLEEALLQAIHNGGLSTLLQMRLPTNTLADVELPSPPPSPPTLSPSSMDIPRDAILPTASSNNKKESGISSAAILGLSVASGLFLLFFLYWCWFGLPCCDCHYDDNDEASEVSQHSHRTLVSQHSQRTLASQHSRRTLVTQHSNRTLGMEPEAAKAKNASAIKDHQVGGDTTTMPFAEAATYYPGAYPPGGAYPPVGGYYYGGYPSYPYPPYPPPPYAEAVRSESPAIEEGDNSTDNNPPAIGGGPIHVFEDEEEDEDKSHQPRGHPSWAGYPPMFGYPPHFDPRFHPPYPPPPMDPNDPRFHHHHQSPGPTGPGGHLPPLPPYGYPGGYPPPPFPPWHPRFHHSSDPGAAILSRDPYRFQSDSTTSDPSSGGVNVMYPTYRFPHPPPPPEHSPSRGVAFYGGVNYGSDRSLPNNVPFISLEEDQTQTYGGVYYGSDPNLPHVPPPTMVDQQYYSGGGEVYYGGGSGSQGGLGHRASDHMFDGGDHRPAPNSTSVPPRPTLTTEDAASVAGEPPPGGQDWQLRDRNKSLRRVSEESAGGSSRSFNLNAMMATSPLGRNKNAPRDDDDDDDDNPRN